VDEPVDHGSGDDLVAEGYTPAAEWPVGLCVFAYRGDF
jgi:hypothetical protein